MADVHELLNHAIAICRESAQAKPNLRITVHLEASAHHALVDAVRLKQVFWNLIHNAIKFTPDGGCVTIRTRNRPDLQADDSAPSLVVDVTDTGIGIDPGVLSRIFNSFEQQDRAVTRRFGGLGMGLAISKAIVDLHGGKIYGCSDGQGHGATFAVELPTCPVSQTLEPSRRPVAAQRG